MTIQELKNEVIAIVGNPEEAKAWVKENIGDMRRRLTWEIVLDWLKQAAKATGKALVSEKAQAVYKAVMIAVVAVSVVIGVGLFRAIRGFVMECVVPAAVMAYRWGEDKLIEVWPVVVDRALAQVDASVGVWAELLVGL